MDATDLRRRLRSALDPEPVPSIEPDERIAAVLIPVIETPEPSILFTLRAPHLSRHAGEISFPVGISQEEDTSAVDTALRETQEELGIEPSAVEVLGALPAVHTFVSSILIVPFVVWAWLAWAGLVTRHVPPRVGGRRAWALLAFLVAFAVVRNLPFPGCHWLSSAGPGG